MRDAVAQKPFADRPVAEAAGEGAFERLQALIAPELARVEAMIAERMQAADTDLIARVAAHLIGAGGKRLRPCLTLAAARLCGHDGENHIRLAAAVEFIHNATLLHDDVVDESDRRRGRPTANAVFGAKPSVLVGDFLFARSFQLMVETGSVEVLGVLSNAAAVIVEGEVLQLAAARSLAGGEDVYFKVIRGKTAALFEAAAQAGGMAAGAPAAQVAALAAYGDALGVAFQIVDDLLDYGGASAAFGKASGGDFREGKATLPVLIAHSRADEAGRAFWKRVIEGRDQREGDFETALELMRDSGALEATRARAEAFAQTAVAALAPLPAGPLREALADVAAFVLTRAR
ncbi:octaprenyl-diphosphate synthase [Rubrimonas cliftonensis]|uniref:Octaprenyl diphosphate synthase n=2 Tax=Rubrimonas cliftonensis TaxID=89524 RepID=A0A1H3Z5L4_9RHOB|nr:octaprenyl-diphosphate synthase [Rubrimonas cliftonensis]